MPQSKRPTVETLSLTVLALVLLGALWFLGGFLACTGVAGVLEEFGGSTHANSGIAALLGGLVYLMVAIGALSSVAWRRGANRVRAVRGAEIGPFLPVLMAVSLVALPLTTSVFSIAYLQVGAAPSWLGYVAWLGAAIGFVLGAIWQPLFPRVTAILVGAIAGVGIFGTFGYLFFESSLSHGEECRGNSYVFATMAMTLGFALLSNISVLWLAPFVALVVGPLLVPGVVSGEMFVVLYVLLLGAMVLWALVTGARITARPRTCAVVSGALAAGMAAVGADIGVF
ncbi:MAG: hypothetical protein OXT70_03505 [Chloroflexota bacterium]|nr:hypothetical protein [Chloroflexota bacterium]